MQHRTSLLTRIRVLFSSHKRRFGHLVVGHTAKQIEEYLFDWLLYAVVVAKATSVWGPVYGSLAAFLIMAPLSAAVCILYIRLYDWMKIDWLGLELLKELGEMDAKSFFARFFQKVLRLGAIPVFFLLSIHADPFVVTVYFRKGAGNHSGLSPRDWRIFWSSVIFSNAYWTVRWTVIIQLAILIWHAILRVI